MPDNETRTWPLAARDAREAAAEAIAYGDDRDADDMAHEYAANDSDTFIHWHAMCIYMDSADVRDYAEDAADLVPADERTPESIASACVYLALRDEYRETIEGLRADAEHSSSILSNAQRMRVRVENGNAYIHLVDSGHLRMVTA